MEKKKQYSIPSVTQYQAIQLVSLFHTHTHSPTYNLCEKVTVLQKTAHLEQRLQHINYHNMNKHTCWIERTKRVTQIMCHYVTRYTWHAFYTITLGQQKKILQVAYKQRTIAEIGKLFGLLTATDMIWIPQKKEVIIILWQAINHIFMQILTLKGFDQVHGVC